MKLFLVDALLSAALLPFFWRGFGVLRDWRSIPVRLGWPDPAAPRVAVCVPARNEERAIGRCVRSLLAQRYPADRLQVVVVDDGSTDRTRAILEQLAAQDERLRVVRGQPLPEGWIGKNWALHQAVEELRASGADLPEYILFTDADTQHAPWALASVIPFAQQAHADLLSLGPAQELGSFAERLLLPPIVQVVVTSNGRVEEVNDPEKRCVAKAVGQYMLFRTSTYVAAGGHSAVRAEIVEDFALARRLKQQGHRVLLLDGQPHVKARMYHSAREIWDGFSKNSFDEMRKAPTGVLGTLLGFPLISFGPWLLLALAWRRRRGRDSLPQRLTRWQALAQVLGLLSVGTPLTRRMGLSPLYALGQPVSALFLWGVMLNSTWRSLTGRGVAWKGRTYDLGTAAQGQAGTSGASAGSDPAADRASATLKP